VVHRAAVWGVVAAAAFLVLGCGGDGEGGPTMRPGDNCLGCHSGGEAAFGAAGTVFTAAGAGAAGLTVTLVDSVSTQASTTTNSAGNFYFEESLVAPFQVSITDGTSTATMADAPGGCNSCHQAGGAAGAHIVFP
jgi:hypothetical protein